MTITTTAEALPGCGLPPTAAGHAARLSAVAADLSAALADEQADPLAPVALLDRACDLLDRLSWALCREPAGFPAGGLREIGRSLAADLRDATPPTADDDAVDVQAQAVTIQAAELADSYRSWDGQGRPAGRNDLGDEIAHLLITTAVLAEMAGIDIDRAIGRVITVTRSPAAHPTRAGDQ